MTGSRQVSRHNMTVRINKWVLVALILATCFDCKATVLYVRFTSNEIIIATDSKRTAETGQTVCVCKLSRIGDTFIASAGLAEYGTFDPKAFAQEAINTSHSLIEARARFEELIQQPLIDVLKKVRSRNPTRYEVFKRGAAINMVFVKFNDLPELAATALTPRDTRDGSIVLDSHPITLTGNIKRAQRIVVGVSKRAESFLDRTSFWSKGTVAGVQRILQMSIEDNKEAGEPIDLVQLTKGTVRWFPREPECDSKSRRINEQPSSCNSSKPQ
jgi:hypothetical protein